MENSFVESSSVEKNARFYSNAEDLGSSDSPILDGLIVNSKAK